jgi:peptide/nickel transport system permease protein
MVSAAPDGAGPRETWLPPTRSRWWRVHRWMRRNPLSVVGAAIMLGLVAMALLVPYLPLQNPVKMNVPMRFSPPSATFWFGTDHLGRDVFSRVAHGAAFSLAIGGMTILLAGVPGVLVGLLGATAPPRLAGLVMRALDVLMSFPALLLAVAVGAALGTGGRSIVLALAVVYFPRIARMTRAIALSVMTQEYVTASRALGTPFRRLLLRTVVPNCLSVVIVQCSLYFAEVLLAEAALSFLGLGEAPPRPTWGNMLYEAQKNMRNAPWLAIFPGAAIAVSVFGLNLFGDAVRDAMDPRLRT